MADPGDHDVFQIVDPQLVISPCTLVCMLDRTTGWCLGCGRTADEIARWTAVTDAGRQEILDALPDRMARLGLA